MAQDSQGIVRTGRGEEQPTDKDRAQRVHQSNAPDATSREATRHPKGNEGKKSEAN